MLTEDQLAEQLRELGLVEGAHVLAHVSLRAIGPIQGGPAALIAAFRRVLGDTGTLLVPTFTPAYFDAMESEAADQQETTQEPGRAVVGVFDPCTSPASADSVGPFPELVRMQPDARRSDHPVVSYAAIGALAEALTAHVPFHYPLGSESPVARLHRLKGWCLLIGVGHEENSALHLAEVWADVPYIHRSARVKTGEDHWVEMQGAPGCTDGFGRIEQVLRQARIAHIGQIGEARAQLMRLQEAISLAVAMLHGAGDSLLCDDPDCPRCHFGRKFTADSTYVEGQEL